MDSLESVVSMPYIHHSNTIVVDMMGTNFQQVLCQLLGLIMKKSRIALLIDKLVVGTYFTKDGISQTTSLWFGWIHILTQNHI